MYVLANYMIWSQHYYYREILLYNNENNSFFFQSLMSALSIHYKTNGKFFKLERYEKVLVPLLISLVMHLDFYSDKQQTMHSWKCCGTCCSPNEFKPQGAVLHEVRLAALSYISSLFWGAPISRAKQVLKERSSATESNFK